MVLLVVYLGYVCCWFHPRPFSGCPGQHLLYVLALSLVVPEESLYMYCIVQFYKYHCLEGRRIMIPRRMIDR